MKVLDVIDRPMRHSRIAYEMSLAHGWKSLKLWSPDIPLISLGIKIPYKEVDAKRAHQAGLRIERTYEIAGGYVYSIGHLAFEIFDPAYGDYTDAAKASIEKVCKDAGLSNIESIHYREDGYLDVEKRLRPDTRSFMAFLTFDDSPAVGKAAVERFACQYFKALNDGENKMTPRQFADAVKIEFADAIGEKLEPVKIEEWEHFKRLDRTYQDPQWIRAGQWKGMRESEL